MRASRTRSCSLVMLMITAFFQSNARVGEAKDSGRRRAVGGRAQGPSELPGSSEIAGDWEFEAVMRPAVVYPVGKRWSGFPLRTAPVARADPRLPGRPSGFGDAPSRLHLSMTEELADHWKTLAERLRHAATLIVALYIPPNADPGSETLRCPLDANGPFCPETAEQPERCISAAGGSDKPEEVNAQFRSKHP